MGYFYRGRHRRPSYTARRAVLVAAGGVLALPAVAGPAAAGEVVGPPRVQATLDAIAGCESGGGPHDRGLPSAVNPRNHAHFGLFQFDLDTWASVGGAGSPAHASRAEQYRRATTLLEDRGTQPWAHSQSCWDDVARPIAASDTITAAAPPATVAPAAKPTKPAPRTSGTYVVKRGDSLWRIAASHYGSGTQWPRLYANNRAVVGSNPALIFPGQRLHL